FFYVGPGKAHDNRQLDIQFLDRVDNALGDPITTIDASEDVDEQRLDVGILKDGPERLLHALWACTATDIEEVGGLAACELDHVQGRHGKASPVDDAADIT